METDEINPTTFSFEVSESIETAKDRCSKYINAHILIQNGGIIEARTTRYFIIIKISAYKLTYETYHLVLQCLTKEMIF